MGDAKLTLTMKSGIFGHAHYRKVYDSKIIFYLTDEASNIIRNWLDRCHNLRQLDFSPNHLIKHNINSAMRGGFRPIGLDKLKIENQYLYNVAYI
jgi:hypothetical protein